MLSGHTHNGQIFPFNFLVRMQFKTVYGLFKEKQSRLFVSSGSGTWGPRMRIGTQNEILKVEISPNSKKKLKLQKRMSINNFKAQEGTLKPTCTLFFKHSFKRYVMQFLQCNEFF